MVSLPLKNDLIPHAHLQPPQEHVEVTQAGQTKTFTYDANGNLTSDGTKIYEWNAQDRLLAVKEGLNTLASFTYDANGSRTTKTLGSITTTYVYNRGQFLEERPSGGVTKRYIYGRGIDRPLAHIFGSVTSYFIADHLGSVARATDASGPPSLTREYDPWGNLLQGSTASGYAFTGREWDSEAGLYYYRARYYDSAIGRFLSEDPSGGSPLGRLYPYVNNNPTGKIDPSGLFDLHAADDVAIMTFRKMWPRCQKLRASSNDEYCGTICECPGGNLEWTAPRKTLSGDELPPCKAGRLVGAYHCHPPGTFSEMFSNEDQDLVLFKGLDVIYLLTPRGNMLRRTKWTQVELGQLQPTIP